MAKFCASGGGVISYIPEYPFADEYFLALFHLNSPIFVAA